MGEPAQSVGLQDGGQEMSYQHVLQKNPIGAAPTGALGRGPGGASNLVCTATFRTDSQGTIVSTDTRGIFDACNDYLGTVTAAQ